MLAITSFPRRFATINKRRGLLRVFSSTTLPPTRQHEQRKHVHLHALKEEKIAISIQQQEITTSGIFPEPVWATTSPRTPYNDPEFPGLLADGALHSIKMTNLATCTRQEVLDYFDNTWALTDLLFSSFQNEQAFITPPPHHLRHPMAFYYGHPTCFYINKCRLAGLLDGPVNPAFEDLFEVGVDEMRWDDMSKNEKEWPSVDEMMAYRRQVYGIIKEILLTHEEFADGHAPITPKSQTWALFMAMEHDRIHLETSSVLMQEHDVNSFEMPALFPKYHQTAYTNTSPSKTPTEGVDFPSNSLIKVNGANVNLGKPLDYPSFGWDNEYGDKELTVGNFEASSMLISNGEFWQFVKDSGYLNPSYWSSTGWAWRSFRNTKWPAFWLPNGPQGSHEYKLRALFDEIPMQWDWPVQVNLHEAQAYCKWKLEKDQRGNEVVYHLLTEPMHHLLREPHERSNHAMDSIIELPSDSTMASAKGRNTNVSYSSFTPVDTFAPNSQGFRDVFGNAWEWCEDNMSPLPGFQIHPVYDDFTVPCFDGEHHIIMGGSYMSSGDNGASKFARYHFRPHFFQHASFRVAASPINSDSKTFDLVTSCINAPEPHAKLNPYRTTSQTPLESSNASVFLTKINQQVDAAWRDFTAGIAYTQLPSNATVKQANEAVDNENFVLVVGEGLTKELKSGVINGIVLVKESWLPMFEKEGEHIVRITMVLSSIWQRK
ncbi:hypothetical protein THRCLA_03709 [Thraustotheca clavata]|uniref:Sulfatase-modifying factor enzyme-like domain-containing protein n=1 Tax=Thraustotheca clavata TaxID=74557 RepID=A0A1W0A169_9STRA|nr:hypothetical protein THRCLA_03709 [Thraustotheca clavata]